MKKLILFFASAVLLTGCSLEEDTPGTAYRFAEVTAADLPAAFEKGKTYTVDISYLLPTPCHAAAGLEVRRGNISGAARRDIYIAGVAAYDANLVQCPEEEEDEEELTREASFSIRIDESEPYTFYLWIGVDEQMQSQYTTVTVPVTEPQGSGQ